MAATPSAKLHPKEHGAYAILGIPIVAALIAVGATVNGVCVAIASVSGFFAHEPLLVAVGHRGRRAQTSTPQARSRLIFLLTGMGIAGGTAMLLGNLEVRVSLVVCLGLAVGTFAFGIVGKHRSIAVQLLGVVGLSSPCVPILLAGDMPLVDALTTWAAWLVGFSSTTVAVRSVIASQKRHSRVGYIVTLVGISSAIALWATFAVYWPMVTLPMVAMSWYLMITPPPMKQIRRVGWALVFGTFATAVLVIYFIG
ncbi:hypothetical protein CA13_38460 [Planctomycetes bacterium CA13]|uniref:Uncharacterized protein n=1 Tax=Novipirellula herctigrandis TaxID=2527986 RepID=A0A5C5Z772_9BACT|nr:hypothetical protein CA13_38460 [Planctomycetes bacterium CA13]